MFIHADTIFTNAAIDTVDPARPRAEAVAIRDGKVLPVGSAEEIAAYRGPDTEAGSATAGKLADFAVFERNLPGIDPEDYERNPVAMTIAEGRIVYDEGQA